MWVLSIRTSAGGPPAARQRLEHLAPHAFRAPADVAIVERLVADHSGREAHPSSDSRTAETCTIPLITRRSSTRGTPRALFGNSGSNRGPLLIAQPELVHHAPPSTGTVNHIRDRAGILLMGPSPRAVTMIIKGEVTRGPSGARRPSRQRREERAGQSAGEQRHRRSRPARRFGRDGRLCRRDPLPEAALSRRDQPGAAAQADARGSRWRRSTRLKKNSALPVTPASSSCMKSSGASMCMRSGRASISTRCAPSPIAITTAAMRKVARDLERRFGHDRVQGAHHERAGVERPDRSPSRAELRQEEKTGVKGRQVKEGRYRRLPRQRRRCGVPRLHLKTKAISSPRATGGTSLSSTRQAAFTAWRGASTASRPPSCGRSWNRWTGRASRTSRPPKALQAERAKAVGAERVKAEQGAAERTRSETEAADLERHKREPLAQDRIGAGYARGGGYVV